MEKRTLGQGLEVTALSLGAMGCGKSRDIPDRSEMIALLRKVVDLGMDFFDTAETYGPWTNEEMVGEAFRGVRDKVKNATGRGGGARLKTGDASGPPGLGCILSDTDGLIAVSRKHGGGPRVQLIAVSSLSRVSSGGPVSIRRGPR
jgi:aryl-alcohol dehydrogenase-like predicted oxidoreductase